VSQIHFYATRVDLLEVLEKIETVEPVMYVRAGFGESADFPVYARAADIPGLGTTDAESWVSATKYLIMSKSKRVVVEEKVFDDHTRYGVYSGVNPDSVELSPSGVLRDGFLIYGRVATLGATNEAKQLQRKFSSAFRKHFRRVGYALVGKEAYALLEAGWRLSQAVQNPPEYALQLPGVVLRSDRNSP
jgi:hypothetical protein